MPLSAIGKRYARRIHDNSITLADVPDHSVADTKDSYKELFGVPIE